MLFRKMLREFKANFGPFFSVFLLAAIAMMLFITMEGHVVSQNVARSKYHDACNLSDIWMYGEGFTSDDLKAVRNLDFVEQAQLRMQVTASAPKQDGAQVDLFLMKENEVNTPLNSRELDDMIALAKEKKLVLAEAMTIWHMPIYKKLWDIVQSGELGKVQIITMNFGSFKCH